MAAFNLASKMAAKLSFQVFLEFTGRDSRQKGATQEKGASRQKRRNSTKKAPHAHSLLQNVAITFHSTVCIKQALENSLKKIEYVKTTV